MTHRLFPISLFVLELSVVYCVTAVAAASVPVDSLSVTTTLAPVPREVRLVIVPHALVEKTSETETEAETVTEEIMPAQSWSYLAVEKDDITVSMEEAVVEKLGGKTIPDTEAEDLVYTVPFYSQFTDISSPRWQKVGCGIASLEMLIDYYADGVESADSLLRRGIAAGAFLSDAGWTHIGLINLAGKYGLRGESVSLASLSADGAFSKLKNVLESGPVMASVHYTFEPTNPIPHLVVVTGVRNGLVYYNDPADRTGNGSISIAKFQRAWKQRYIEIRPV